MVVGSLANPIIDFLADSLITPLLTNDAFTRGFFWGLFVALVVGTVFRYYLYFVGKIQLFFKPTQRPATTPGPSPFDTLLGCTGAILKLSLVAGILIVIFVACS
jgi:hypothetical protein